MSAGRSLFGRWPTWSCLRRASRCVIATTPSPATRWRRWAIIAYFFCLAGGQRDPVSGEHRDASSRPRRLRQHAEGDEPSSPTSSVWQVANVILSQTSIGMRHRDHAVSGNTLKAMSRHRLLLLFGRWPTWSCLRRALGCVIATTPSPATRWRRWARPSPPTSSGLASTRNSPSRSSSTSSGSCRRRFSGWRSANDL